MGRRTDGLVVHSIDRSFIHFYLFRRQEDGEEESSTQSPPQVGNQNKAQEWQLFAAQAFADIRPSSQGELLMGILLRSLVCSGMWCILSQISLTCTQLVPLLRVGKMGREEIRADEYVRTWAGIAGKW